MELVVVALAGVERLPGRGVSDEGVSRELDALVMEPAGTKNKNIQCRIFQSGVLDCGIAVAKCILLTFECSSLDEACCC